MSKSASFLLLASVRVFALYSTRDISLVLSPTGRSPRRVRDRPSGVPATGAHFSPRLNGFYTLDRDGRSAYSATNVERNLPRITRRDSRPTSAIGNALRVGTAVLDSIASMSIFFFFSFKVHRRH